MVLPRAGFLRYVWYACGFSRYPKGTSPRAAALGTKVRGMMLGDDCFNGGKKLPSSGVLMISVRVWARVI